MNTINNIQTINAELHDKVRDAITAAFGSSAATIVAPVTGGASGALAWRVAAGGRDYLLRLEGKRNPLRNPHQYTCMRMAAAAGIAPCVQHIDETNGVAIIDYIQQQPLMSYPGGPTALVAALGTLVRELQQAGPFPVLGDYRSGIERIIGHVRALFAPGLLDPFIDGMARLRAACAWDAATHVSSHNDPNPRNILFDGTRLWLVDWETSYRNDPLVDIAVLVENFATTPELENLLLTAWRGVPPDATLKSRLILVRLMTRLYYAGLLSLLAASPQAPVQDLSAPTPEQFKAMLASGKLVPTSKETLLVLAKMLLASFRNGMESPELQRVMASLCK